MVDISTNLVNERDTEIRKIVETIADLAQIMRDLATLVIEQGTMLDRIDQNVTQTAVKVRSEGMQKLSGWAQVVGTSGGQPGFVRRTHGQGWAGQPTAWKRALWNA